MSKPHLMRDMILSILYLIGLAYVGAQVFLTYMPTRICVPGDVDYRISK